MNIRYQLCPQMKIYDQIGYRWLPNIMFNQKPNYKSEILNTDNYGLRFNSKKNSLKQKTIFETEYKNNNISVLIGGSASFGVGSDSDEKTIASNLSKNSNTFVYNFGGTAFNGFQEIILFLSLINKLDNLKNIVIFSGINDLYMFSNENFLCDFPGPFYFNKKFLTNMNNSNIGFKRLLLKYFLKIIPLSSNENDFININKKDLMKYLINSNFRKNLKSKIKYPEISIKEVIVRNLKFWKFISLALEINVTFFFQPLIYWCKELCSEEEKLIEYSKDLDVLKFIEKFKNIDKYQEIKNLFEKECLKNNIKFFDTNEFFKDNSKKNDWLFVDHIHLNNNGYEFLSNFIKEKI